MMAGERGKVKGERKTDEGFLLSFISKISSFSFDLSSYFILIAPRAGLLQMIQPSRLTGFVGVAPRRDRIETPEKGFSSKEERTVASDSLLLLTFPLSPFLFSLSAKAQ